jgi:site-specific DNA-methyltransferase (adenine-specific)
MNSGWRYQFMAHDCAVPTRLRDGWEYCFHLAKTKTPYINQQAVRKPVGEWVQSRLAKLGENDLSRHNSVNNSGFGRDLSKWVGKQTVLPPNVITAALVGKNKGHPAVFPVDLPLFFIRLLCPADGLVVDPFAGSGTTGIAALALSRRCILIDNSSSYCKIAAQRLRKEVVASPNEVSWNRRPLTLRSQRLQVESYNQPRLLEPEGEYPAPGRSRRKRRKH